MPDVSCESLLGQRVSLPVTNCHTCFSLQLAAVLMVLKGLPSTYNKDLQVKEKLVFTPVL